MTRFLLLLKNELKLARTSIPVHVIAMLQPSLMYLLMSAILVFPTFDMYVTEPSNEVGHAMVAAMREVGSPIGVPYINPILIGTDQPIGLRQVVSVEERGGLVVAIQRYGLIDSNIVKNFRNRLTSAGLRVWNEKLGDQAVQIEEIPWLSRDMPFTLYFGIAMLPLSAALAASIIGGTLTAQEYEFGTILEYRLAPINAWLVTAARLIRLAITGLIASIILLIILRFVNGHWPNSIWKVVLILIPIGIIFGGIGVSAGLLFRKSIPAFLVGLVTSFVGWLVGSAFGLAAGFSRVYEFISRLTPNTHTVELLFPLFFGTGVGSSWLSIFVLAFMSVMIIGLVLYVYRLRVLKQF